MPSLKLSGGSITDTTGTVSVGSSNNLSLSGNLQVTGTGPHYISQGNVGIGTTSPAEALVVDRTSGDIFQRFDQSGTIKGLVGVAQTVAHGSSGAVAGDMIVRGQANLLLDTGGTTRMEILNNGNVGIGTTSPGYKLEVDGTVRSGKAAASAANQPALRVTAANTAASGRVTAIQQLTAEGDTRLFADYEPYVEYGMYARNSDDSIHFTAGSATNGLESWTEYNTAGTARTAYSKMKVSLGDGQVTIGGNLGIGTTSPAYKLVVVGDIYASNGGDLRLQTDHPQLNTQSLRQQDMLALKLSRIDRMKDCSDRQPDNCSGNQ
jgi:hypothetical protein